MSVVDEGFICPYCLVGFATSGKLQSHFVEMHSSNETSLGWEVGGESSNVGATAGYEQLGNEEESVNGLLGHQFVQRRMQKPSSCSACEEIIWQDGIACQSCPVVIHVDGCRGQLTVPCTTVSETPEVRQHKEVQRSSGPQQPAKGPLALVRRQIAKGRERYVNEEFDLDLTYITERIIAMSFPATGMESAYRNSLKDVAKMLKTKHQENYMIFNLSERSYDISRFNNQVLDFGWPDHLAPSLERLSSVCRSMKSWLDSDPQHVVVVHCKGGKGRTGCVIAAFMNYSEICQSAEDALDRFAMKRFYDSKCVGVTQPSQRKYVYYFADLLAGKMSLKTPPVLLNHVIIHGVPNFDGKGGCRVFLKVYVNMKLEHTTGLYVSNEEDERIKITLHGGGLNLQGEVLLKCFHKKSHSGMDSVFRCQFHTAIVRDTLRLVLKKEDLDDAFKDKKFPENSKVELLFERDTERLHGSKEDVDVRSSLLETNGAGAPVEVLKNESLSKRDSYANFEGGFDSGADLIRFSPTSPHNDRMGSPPVARDGASRGQRSRAESTESFNMDPQAIERVTMAGSSEVYTVVNKSAPGIRGRPHVVPLEPLSSTPRSGQNGKPASLADPPYVNQTSIPSKPPEKKPITYRRSLKVYMVCVCSIAIYAETCANIQNDIW
jgi:protein-tyrosine phosphatase